MTEAERDEHLMAPDVLLADCSEVVLSQDEAARFLTGLRRKVTLPDADLVRVYGPMPGATASEGRVLLGSAHVQSGELIPTRLLSPLEVQGLVSQQATEPVALATH
jgi:tRNA pseudouridine55 synthase